MKTESKKLLSLHSWTLHLSNAHSYKHNPTGFGKNCQKLTRVCSVQKRCGLRAHKCSNRKTNDVFTLSDVSLSTKYRVYVCNCVKVLSNSFCLIAHSYSQNLA